MSQDEIRWHELTGKRVKKAKYCFFDTFFCQLNLRLKKIIKALITSTLILKVTCYIVTKDLSPFIFSV